MLGLCERFGQLPEQIYAADSELARLVLIEQLGRREEGTPGG